MTLLALALLLGSTQAACPTEVDAPAIDSIASAVAGASRLSIELTPRSCEKRHGRALADGELASVADVALDTYCGELIAGEVAPNGFLTVFGSARLNEGTPDYAAARELAGLWAKSAPGIPIATGGGPGIMEAANRGARESGARTIGFATFFGASGVERPNAFTTDAYMFTDFATRERALFQHARGVVVFPGGFGTAWELFQALSEVQTGKLKPMPIVLVGGAETWAPTMALVEQMRAAGTISPRDLDLLRVVQTPAQALEVLQGATRP